MSEEILKFATNFTLYSGYITVVFGIIGNAISIFVFTQLKLFRNNRSVFYLTIDACANFVYHLSTIIATSMTSVYGDDGTARSIVWCRARYTITQAAVLTSYTMICLAAGDQYFSTNYRVDLRHMCTFKLARYLSYIFICVWFLHSIMFGLFFDIQQSIGCIITNQIGLQYATFFVYPVLIGFLPIIIALLFSILAYRNVRRIVRRQLPIVRRRLDRQMTAMVLLRVGIFVLSASPYSIYRIYAINFPIPRSQALEYAIGRLLQAIFIFISALTFTVNFYAFVISSSRYRRQVKFVFKRTWRLWNACCSSGNNQVAPMNSEAFGENMELEDIN